MRKSETFILKVNKDEEYPTVLLITECNLESTDYVSCAIIVGKDLQKDRFSYYSYQCSQELMKEMLNWEMEKWFKNLKIPQTTKLKKTVNKLKIEIMKWNNSIANKKEYIF